MPGTHEPDILRTARALFEDAWRHGASPRLAQFDAQRRELHPEQVARFDPVLRNIERGAWSRAHIAPNLGLLTALLGLTSRMARIDDRHLARNPRLALAFVHAHSGHLREAAVQHMPLKAGDTPALTALLLRCNDWVAPVREAARARLAAVLPALKAGDLQPLCLFVFERSRTWGRGGADAACDVMAHPDWTQALEATLRHEVNGPLARVLRQLLRGPGLDAHLPDLAADARSAFVRAVTTQALLEGYARWPVGTEWRWIDKSAGQRQRITVFDTRPIDTSEIDLARVAVTAARDRSAIVRKHAADYLIAQGPDGLGDVADALRDDRARAVAERMDYFDRKWRGATVPPEGDPA